MHAVANRAKRNLLLMMMNETRDRFFLLFSPFASAEERAPVKRRPFLLFFPTLLGLVSIREKRIGLMTGPSLGSLHLVPALLWLPEDSAHTVIGRSDSGAAPSELSVAELSWTSDLTIQVKGKVCGRYVS